MNETLRLGGVTESDIAGLMHWFPDKASTQAWGGPNFRFPFTRETFREDMRFGRLATYSLRGESSGMVAFGQLYERFERINMARLAVHPDHRGKGIGANLVEHLMKAGKSEWPLREYSLFVYTDNKAAIACYESVGFRPTEFPEGAPMQDVTIYMTRPVERQP